MDFDTTGSETARRMLASGAEKRAEARRLAQALETLCVRHGDPADAANEAMEIGKTLRALFDE